MIVDGWDLGACGSGDLRPNPRHIITPSPDGRHAAVIHDLGEASHGVETGRLFVLAAPAHAPTLRLSSRVICLDVAPQWIGGSRFFVVGACGYVCAYTFVDVERGVFARRRAALDMVGRAIAADDAGWLLPGSDDEPDQHPATRIIPGELAWRPWSEIRG